MHPNTEKTRLHIGKMLKAYSIDEIIALFHSIDERIIEIINFSSEDFMRFNATFRSYYHDINIISNSLLRLYTSFNEQQNNQYAAEIETLVNSLEQKLKNFEDLIEFTAGTCDQALKNLEQIFIPANNFYQDLSTLKLLATNLKLDKSFNNHIAALSSNIESIFKAYPDFVENLKKLKKFVGNSYKTTESLRPNYLESAYQILVFCKQLASFILTKQKEAVTAKPILEDILKQTQETISTILVNLQYQDIVKQKIEHIKHIHKELVEKLSILVDKSDEADYELSCAKLFFKVKEIANLQSAQMVYANHEYQKAVENITSRFFLMSNQMDKITGLFTSFSEASQLNQISCFDADFNIRKEVNLINEIDSVHSIFQLQTEGIIQRITNFSSSFRQITRLCQDFVDLIGNIRSTLNPLSFEDPDSGFAQIAIVSEELVNSLQIIKSGMDKNATLITMLNAKYHSEYLDPKYEDIQKHDVKALSNAFRELNYINREILQAANSRKDYSVMLNELKNTVESVQYYKHFELEAIKIIKSLDEISEKLWTEGDEIHEHQAGIDLNIQRKYTVDSEHRIHEYIMNRANKEKSFSELTKKIESVKNEEEDNLELF